MSFPPTHALVAVGLAEVVIALKPAPRWRVWGVAALLGVMPDFDIILGLLLALGGTLHGTMTHSLSAVVIAALVAYAFGGGRWALIAGTAYGSHLLVDMLDDRGPTNLMLGWPFTDAHPDAFGRFFPRVPMSGDGVIDTALSLLRPEPLVKLVVQTLMGVMIFLVLAAIARVIRRRREAAAPAC
ncbi:MAG TPA: metal-dependent hydrolase [Longimicrobium sp.]|nr:metal-dependent hydrolase [Longimicrobium sp.]